VAPPPLSPLHGSVVGGFNCQLTLYERPANFDPGAVGGLQLPTVSVPLRVKVEGGVEGRINPDKL